MLLTIIIIVGVGMSYSFSSKIKSADKSYNSLDWIMCKYKIKLYV